MTIKEQAENIIELTEGNPEKVHNVEDLQYWLIDTAKRVIVLYDALEQQKAQLQLLANLAEDDEILQIAIDGSYGLIEKALKQAGKV